MLWELGRLLGTGFGVSIGLALALRLLVNQFVAPTLRRSMLRDSGGGESDQPPPVHPLLSAVHSCVLAVSLAAALLAGVTVQRGELAAPTQYWHWLPIAGLAVALVYSPATLLPTLLRRIGWAAAAAWSAWLLVPTWPNLEPTQTVMIPMLAVYLFFLGWLFERAANRARAGQHFTVLIVTAITLAVCVAVLFSLEYAEVALMVAASLAGCWLSTIIVKCEQASLVPLMACTSLLLGGIAFVSYVYPQPPIYEFLLVPLVPTAMLFSPAEGDGRIGFWRPMLPSAVVLVVVLIVLLIQHGFA